MITNEQLDALEAYYTPAEDQKCRVCGAPLRFSASDHTGSRYNCSSDDASPHRKPLGSGVEHYRSSSWVYHGQTDAMVASLVRAYRELAAALPQLRWAPHQEFGIPDPAAETHEPPPRPVTIGAVGYRDRDIIIYWAEA